MRERKSNECGGGSQSRGYRTSQEPRNMSRPRDNTLFSSYRKTTGKGIAKKHAPKPTFKDRDAVSALGEALREAGL